jgi:isoamyl acetate esterase
MNAVLLEEQTAVSTTKPKRFTCSRSKWTSAGLGLFLFTVAVVLGMILGTVSNTPLTGPVASRPMVMLVGDSITQFSSNSGGWATRLQAEYVRSVDVINRGLSGYSTQAFLDKAMTVVSHELKTSFAPVLITVCFGANDASLADGPAAEKHVPLDKYQSNLVSILTEFRRVAPQAKILVISPPVVDDDTRRERQVAGGGKSDPIDRTNTQASLYAMASGSVVQGLKDDSISFLNLHSYMMSYDNTTARNALLSDGLHLSSEGNRVVFDQVRSQMQSLLPASVLNTPQIPEL